MAEFNPSQSLGIAMDKPAKYKIDKGFYESSEYKNMDTSRPAGMAVTYSPYFGTAGSGAISYTDEAYRAYAKRTGFDPDKNYTGNENMAVTDEKLKGKKGTELQASVIAQQAETADKTILDPSEKLSLTTQEVQDNELMGAKDYDISETTAKDPTKVDPSKFVQSQPTKTDSPEYTASTVGDVGKMEDVTGKVSDPAIMTAAQGTVSPESLAQAATQELDAKATVSYQLAELYKGIESGTQLPAWASPAVRKVSSIMAQRGLGASSMASAAMVQAVYEAGVPIAVADANKYATIQLQNLSNTQQATLQNATVMAAMDTANLNNRQLAAVNNAKSFLSMDVQNLNNDQQKATLDFQQKVSGMFTDAAQSNAAKQFNAKTQGEIDQFFAELGVSVESTSLNRKAALEQYNVSQSSAIEQFNAQMITQREQFNSNNQKQIDASNAQWRRTINTASNAATNEENRTNLQTLLGLSTQAQNNLWQLYRDQAGWAMSTSENNLDRAHNAAMQAAAISEAADMYDTKFDDFLIVKTIDNIFG